MGDSRSRRPRSTAHTLVLLTTFVLCFVIGESIYESCDGKTLLKSGPLSCQDRHVILDTHNQLRQSIALGRIAGQPGATNMLEMVWDDELASVAQRWANRCAMSHDGARNVARFQVGQNIAATWSTKEHAAGAPDFNRQINGWFKEVRGFRFYSSGLSHSTGHYTQLVWADTYLVGCGYSYFFDSRQGYTKLYICNYGPAGNVLGSYPYNPGNPSCPTQGLNPSTRYHGLCEVRGGNPLGTCSYGGYEPTQQNAYNAVQNTYRATQSVLHPVQAQSVLHPVQVQSFLHPVQVQSVLHPVQVQSVLHPVQAQSVLHPVQVQSVLHPVQVQSVLHPVQAALQAAVHTGTFGVSHYTSVRNVAAYGGYNFKHHAPYTYHG